MMVENSLGIKKNKMLLGIQKKNTKKELEVTRVYRGRGET